MGGLDVLSFLVQVPFRCSNGLGEMFVDILRCKPWPGREVTSLNGLGQGVCDRAETCLVEKLNEVGCVGSLHNVVDGRDRWP